MSEKVLFSIIGVLMLAITGIGAKAAITHPQEVGQIVPEAVQTVESAVENTSQAVMKAAATVFTNTSVTSVPDDSSSFSRDDRGGEDEDRDEDEDGDDDHSSNDRGQSSAQTQTTAAPVQAKAQSASAPATGTSFTMADVAAHASASSCYTAINGSVYDLTSFVSRHPGGSSAIKSLCGVDGTNAYMNQHGGSGRPASELASLKIGTLAK